MVLCHIFDSIPEAWAPLEDLDLHPLDFVDLLELDRSDNHFLAMMNQELNIYLDANFTFGPFRILLSEYNSSVPTYSTWQ